MSTRPEDLRGDVAKAQGERVAQPAPAGNCGTQPSTELAEFVNGYARGREGQVWSAKVYARERA